QLEKIERIEKPITYHKQARVRFDYDVDPPQQLLQVQDVDISVGEGTSRKTLVESLSFEVRRGEKWGIIGDNGIGKSTLLKELQGILPHKGRVRWTSNVKRSYFEQESANLTPAKTIMQEIHDRVPTWTELQVRSLLGQVRITGEDVYKQIGVISGGERAKVCFAVMMIERGNVLILDEPTNHLDISMKEVIEEALVDFGGTLLFVSHDRYLLDKVADRILEITAEGVRIYNGGFAAWLEAEQQRQRQQKAAAAETREQSRENGEKPAYRSKQQRAAEAKMRARKRELEKLCDELQEELDRLTEETAKEEVYSDFELMQEKCSRMEEIRQQTDEALEELILLEDELG
ncbi:MAG: ATP-binding cassette domain-containing protein, partial [Ruminococcus sp.]